MRDVTRFFVPRPLRRFPRLGVATAVIILALVCVLTMASTPAPAAEGRLASILVDAADGRVLEEDNADLPRYPASLTKMMTIYLTFEALDAGRATLDQPLSVSARAAAQSPTKLGLRAGQWISLEAALLGLVTKSANDAAMVLAENLAGGEETFAVRMTGKAHALGMSQTVFRNASGLPDPDQVTTARDMATLALSLLHHYPHYYHYFSVREFYYSGRPIANHNRLLGVYEGVDGIKTGYTRAAGFNLVASAQRGDRRLIGVVLGAPSSRVRNAMMTDLLDQAFRGDQQIQLASVSYYLNGAAALAANDVGEEISSARSQVAYVPAAATFTPRRATAAATYTPRRATVAAKQKRAERMAVAAASQSKAACGRGGRRGVPCQALAVRSTSKATPARLVVAANSPRVSAKRPAATKAVARAPVAASAKSKITVASDKSKPSLVRGKTIKASATAPVAKVATRKSPADGTKIARR